MTLSFEWEWEEEEEEEEECAGEWATCLRGFGPEEGEEDLKVFVVVDFVIQQWICTVNETRPEKTNSSFFLLLK